MTQPMESNDFSGIDTDAIIQSVESGQDYVAPAPEPAQAEPAPEPAAAVEQPKTYEFTWNGQRVKGTEEQLLQWASQGYDYSQRMQEINNQKKEFERYREIDEYIKTNPDWWSHVENSWQSRETANLDPSLRQALDPVLKELSSVKEFMTAYQREQLEKQAKEEDARLESEIGSLQQKFPDVDFSSKDNQGQTLEYRVINHATQNGIPTFTAAFYDYYQDHLAKIYESRGRSAVEKELQNRRQSGLLGESQAPLQNLQFGEGSRVNSWEDAHLNAMRELGLA